MLLGRLIDLYSLVVIAAVIVSWAQLPPYHPAVRFLNKATEPFLAPLRRIVPPLGGLDVSPMLLLVLLQLQKGMLY